MSVPQPSAVFRFILQSSKRIAVSVVGGVLVLGGLAMLVLPGPGLLVVVAGFAVLGTEYAWAARALERTKSAAESAGKVAKEQAGKAGRVAVDTGAKVGRATVDTSAQVGRVTVGTGAKVGRATWSAAGAGGRLLRRRKDVDG